MPFDDLDEPAAPPPWPAHLRTWQAVLDVAVPCFLFGPRQYVWVRAANWDGVDPQRGVLPPCLYDEMKKRIRHLSFETQDGATAAVAMIVMCPEWGVRGEK